MTPKPTPTLTVESTNALFSLFELMKDPRKHEAALADLAAARDEAVQEQTKLRDLQAKRDALNADRAAFEKSKTDEWNAIHAAKAALEVERSDHAAAKADLDAARGAYATDRANLKESQRKHSADLAELARVRGALGAHP